MKTMDFDTFKSFIKNTPAPASRLGIFNLFIKNKRRTYYFEQLKESASFNNDLFGFSLNHYGWFSELPKPNNNSQFYDGEDCSIDIWRNDFINAETLDGVREIKLTMKNWTAVISW